MENIAVINLLRLGDVFQTVPFLKILGRLKKNINVTLICTNIDVDIVRDLGLVDAIIKVDIKKIVENFTNADADSLLDDHVFLQDLLHKLPFKTFDTVFNLNSLKLNSHLVDYCAVDEAMIYGPLYKEGYLLKDRLFSYLFAISGSKKESVLNLSELYLAYLIESGSSFADLQLSHMLPEAESTLPGGSVIINISTGDKVREFGDKFYVDLINKLSPLKRIVIVGTDSSKGEAIMSGVLLKDNILNLTAKTTIKELFQLLKEGELFISPDTGTVHLAAMAGIKILGLFNVSAYHHLTGPYSGCAYFLTPSIDCYPCEEFFQPCGNFTCRAFYQGEIVASAAEYVMGGKEIFSCPDLIFSRYVLDDLKGGYLKILSGKGLAAETVNIRKVVKELLFKSNSGWEFVTDNSLYWQQFAKIYAACRQASIFTDLKRFIKQNKRYPYLLPLLEE